MARVVRPEPPIGVRGPAEWPMTSGRSRVVDPDDIIGPPSGGERLEAFGTGMRTLFVFNLWESFVSVGESLLTELVIAALAGGFAGLLRLRRKRFRTVDRAIAARIADRQALEGIPMRMKAAIHRRMGPATAAAARAIEARDRVGPEVAAQRAEKAVNNTIAWLLTMYHEAGRLGRLRLAIEFPFLFRVCVAYQVALLERRTAPELADLLVVR